MPAGPPLAVEKGGGKKGGKGGRGKDRRDEGQRGGEIGWISKEEEKDSIKHRI
jgi:hypothetical protein